MSKKKPFTKEDMRIGDFAQIENGWWYKMVTDDGVLINENGESYLFLEWYDDNFHMRENRKGYDIVAVTRPENRKMHNFINAKRGDYLYSKW